MKKKRQDYLYNEHDDNQVLAKRKNMRRKKRKRRRIALLLITVIIAIIAFFCSDLSRVQTIDVEGNEHVLTKDILENIPIKKHESYTFFTKNDEIEKEVKKMTFIKSVHVTKTLTGNITIKVKESEPIIYTIIQDILYVADDTGQVKEDKEQSWLAFVKRCPQSINFDLETFKAFAKEYAKVSSVVQNQVSNIQFVGEESDPTKCQLELDDGKVFYLRIEDMASQMTSTNYYYVLNKYPDYKFYNFLGKNVYVSQ